MFYGLYRQICQRVRVARSLLGRVRLWINFFHYSKRNHPTKFASNQIRLQGFLASVMVDTRHWSGYLCVALAGPREVSVF